MKKKFIYSLVFVITICAMGFFYASSQLDYDEMIDEYTLTPIQKPIKGELTFQWLGNATVLVSDGQHSIMTDGWFSRPRLIDLPSGIKTDMAVVKHSLAKAGVDRLSAVIPIHSHYDHLMDAPAVAELTEAVLFGSESSANAGRGWGLPEEQILVVDKKRSQQFGDFKVTLLKSKHYDFVSLGGTDIEPDKDLGPGSVISEPITQPLGALDYSEGGAYSVVIEHPQATIVIHGSAGYVDNLLSGVKADIVFLGVAGVAVQTEQYQQDYWREVVKMTEPSVIVPIHWDSLNHPLGDVPEAPMRLVDSILLNVKMKDSVMWLMNKDDSLFTPLFPMWEKVPLSQLTQPEIQLSRINKKRNSKS